MTIHQIAQPRHCETCNALLVRAHRRRSDGRLNGQEPLQLFLTRKTCGIKCRRSSGHKPWNDAEVVILRALYPYFASPLVAKAIGRGWRAVNLKAEALGIKKTAKGRSNAARYAQALRNGRVPDSPQRMRMVDGPRQAEREAA